MAHSHMFAHLYSETSFHETKIATVEIEAATAVPVAVIANYWQKHLKS